MKPRNNAQPLAQYLSIGLILAAAGAVIAALNHISVAVNFATGATTQEEIASALASELVAERWGLISLLLILAAVVLRMTTSRTDR